jgi:Ca2+-binding EF-hand superfamily protein
MSLGRWAICQAIAAIAAGLLLWSCALADPPQPDASAPDPATDDSVQRLLLLTPGQPLRIDLALELDGRPLGQAWRAWVEQLVADMAYEVDGTLPIDAAVQIADFASGSFGQEKSPARIRSDLRVLAEQPAAEQPATGDRIRRRALLDYIARAFPPFVITAGSAPGAAAAPALFGLLDADGDGRLSRGELAAAERRLAVRDFDDDQLISERELIVDPTQQASGFAANRGQPSPPPDPVLLLSPAAAPQSIATAILRRYDQNGDGRLSMNAEPTEISLPEAVAARLDVNGDGNLDAVELAALAAEPPAAVLRLPFGSAGPARRSEKAGGEASELRVRKKIEGGYKLHWGNVQIDVNRNNRDPRQTGGSDLRFASFDADQNGYLDRMEAKANPLLAATFDGMDSDHDDKVTPGELQIYADGQNVAAAMRLRLQVVDRGQDLFSVFDANGDGLLTPRELRAAPALLDADEGNADGSLGGSKIPVRWSLDLARRSLLAAPAATGPQRVRAPQLAAGQAGPDWFRNMDRNHDGDLTPREFLGTAADFSSADTDHDGLVDAQEAAAVRAK